MTIIAAVIISVTVQIPDPPNTAGYWSQYGQSVTDAQRHYAVEHGYVPDWWAGPMVALPTCDPIGNGPIFIDLGDGWQPAYVFDCLGGDGDPAAWGEGKLIGEVDYYTTAQYGMVRKGGWLGKVSIGASRE
jgi:hypothetical protein